MKQYRNKIDSIDNKLVMLLSQRMKIVKEIAKYKKKNNIPIFYKTREQQILSEKNKLAKKYKLDQNFIKNVFKTIMKESKIYQKKIFLL